MDTALVDAVEVLARLDAAQARVLFGRLVEGRVIIPGGGAERAAGVDGGATAAAFRRQG